MANRVVLVGGTGLLGSALRDELVRRGVETVTAARGPASDLHADVLAPKTLTALFRRGDTVVHLVARSPVRRPPGGRAGYRRIHVDGTRNLLSAARAAGVARFVYVSALGVTTSAGAAYAETKARAEQLVKHAGIPRTIVAPSILFAAQSELIRLLQTVSRLPVVPLPRIEAPFRPIHVSDAATRIADAVTADQAPSDLVLTGPELLSLTDFVRRYLRERGTAFVLLPAALTPLLLTAVSALKLPGAPAELKRMLAIDNAGAPPPAAEELTRYSRWVGRPTP